MFWKNPANYVGWALTHGFEFTVRLMLRFYGKKVRILSKTHRRDGDGKPLKQKNTPTRLTRRGAVSAPSRTRT